MRTESSVVHAEGVLGDANVAAVAALVGDSTRATMLDVLMDGGAHPSGELARQAGVAASTASEHLARLREGGLVVREIKGRESRYRLASAETAEALEALARLAAPMSVRSLREANKGDALAGALGASLAEALIANCWVRRRTSDRGLILTKLGRTALRRELGVRLT